MNIISAVTRAATKTADVTTAATGAIGGAAVSGVVGAARGAANGVRTGLDNGSRSPAAAALTIGAIGAAGLVEWPVLLTVGGTALVLHRISQRTGEADGAVSAPDDQTSNKAATSNTRRQSRPARKATAARRTTKT